MAYFRVGNTASGGGTGTGATITVTYSSQFYNKTITCTKGTTTYTKTTTSSGSTTFNVSEAGTWTITCNGVSRTVDVVLEYSTQMAITKTVTVYSAASDTVSFTDTVGAKTVTTNANGQGSVSITFIPPSANITFTSSIAKNPDDLTAYYSKNVNLTNNTTEVYVMPNSALYWYGYKASNCSTMYAESWTWGSYTRANTTTDNTNYIDVTTTSNTFAGIVSTTKMPANSTAHVIVKGITNASGASLAFAGCNTLNFNDRVFVDALSTLNSIEHLSQSSNADVYLACGCAIGRRGYLYAMWYE